MGKKKQLTFFSYRSKTIEQSSPVYILSLISLKNLSKGTKLVSKGCGAREAVVMPRREAGRKLAEDMGRYGSSRL